MTDIFKAVHPPDCVVDVIIIVLYCTVYSFRGWIFFCHWRPEISSGQLRVAVTTLVHRVVRYSKSLALLPFFTHDEVATHLLFLT